MGCQTAECALGGTHFQQEGSWEKGWVWAESEAPLVPVPGTCLLLGGIKAMGKEGVRQRGGENHGGAEEGEGCL